jgi:hypothetical protein
VPPKQKQKQKTKSSYAKGTQLTSNIHLKFHCPEGKISIK